MIAPVEMLIAADLLEESGFEVCRTLREMAGACDPRPFEPWEVPDAPHKSPVENRIDYWCRLFRATLEKQVDWQRCEPPYLPDMVDVAVNAIVMDEHGEFYAQVME